MSFLSDFVTSMRFAKELMFKYKEATKERAGVKETLYYIFLVLLVPASIGLVMSVAVHASSAVYMLSDPLAVITGPAVYEGPFDIINQVSPENSPLLPMPVVLAIRFALDIVVPMAVLLAFAGLMHVIGRVFRLIDGHYGATLSSLAYGATPGIMISWLATPLVWIFGPVGGWVVGAATFIWGVTVGVTALENQHGIGPGRALVVYFLPAIFVFVTLVVSVSVFVYSFTFDSMPFYDKLDQVDQVRGTQQAFNQADTHTASDRTDSLSYCVGSGFSVESVTESGINFSVMGDAETTNVTVYDGFGERIYGLEELTPGVTISVRWVAGDNESVSVRGLCHGNVVVEGRCEHGQACWNMPPRSYQEDFMELVSRNVEIVDASCTESSYYVSLRNLDSVNSIDTADIAMEVDDNSVNVAGGWDRVEISSGEIALVEISDFLGEPGSNHVIKATGPNGRPVQIAVPC